MSYYCRFCAVGFHAASVRDAHQLTCQPWKAEDAERVRLPRGSFHARDPRAEQD